MMALARVEFGITTTVLVRVRNWVERQPIRTT
jgi:hypothetical protein